MSHYEERLEQDLVEIRTRLESVGSRVLAAFRDSVHSVLVGDSSLASETILGDLPVNRDVREIDRLSHAFVARHLPSAGHLRFVSSALRLNVALERIGDYAVTISREQVQLSEPPPKAFAGDVELIAEQADLMLKQSLEAFNAANAELARGTKPMATQIEGTFQKVFDELVEEGERETRSLRDLFALLTIINRIGRVADQAKNICEETVFAATGETKEPKVYSVLFLDRRDDSLGQLAVAYGRKAFPASARFHSAGWEPAERIDPRAGRAAERRGLDLTGLEPSGLDSIRDAVDDAHVIVGLQEGARASLGDIPFHTVFLEWSPAYPDPGGDQERVTAVFEQSLQALSVEIRQLMETLRGEGAD